MMAMWTDCKRTRIFASRTGPNRFDVTAGESMQPDTGNLLNEADIGSGEKQPGQRDTEQEIKKVRNPKMDDTPAAGSASDDKPALAKKRKPSIRKR
jgi:hypothetical protein